MYLFYVPKPIGSKVPDNYACVIYITDHSFTSDSFTNLEFKLTVKIFSQCLSLTR
jgi:hypothetical protein